MKTKINRLNNANPHSGATHLWRPGALVPTCPLVHRGVQYVHCVMQTCIAVKVGGNEKHIHLKYVKSTYILRTKSEGKFGKVVGKEKFREIVGNVLKEGK